MKYSPWKDIKGPVGSVCFSVRENLLTKLNTPLENVIRIMCKNRKEMRSYRIRKMGAIFVKVFNILVGGHK